MNKSKTGWTLSEFGGLQFLFNALKKISVKLILHQQCKQKNMNNNADNINTFCTNDTRQLD